MQVQIKRAPNAICCHWATDCSTALFLTTSCLAVCICMSRDAVAQPESERPSQNAAGYYRQAVEQLDQLSDSDRALIQNTVQLRFSPAYSQGSSWSKNELVRFSDDVPTDERAKETVARLGRALHFFGKAQVCLSATGVGSIRGKWTPPNILM